VSIDWDLITPEILDSLKLDEVLAGAEAQECFAYLDVVSKLLKEPSELTPVQQNALRFVSATVNMMLQHGNVGDPFGPMHVFGGRNAAPGDLPREKIKSLAAWSRAIKTAELRARMLDVTWIVAKSFPAAQDAVTAYLEAADVLEDPSDWTMCGERLERALRLAASLGKGGVALRDTVLAKIESVIHKYKGADPLFHHRTAHREAETAKAHRG